ncbi:MAG: hypothetical protein MJZ20_14690 [Bacteroidaceae bacterium]|nr:hypothetical protein [Bacteroidaceae bacterium]
MSRKVTKPAPPQEGSDNLLNKIGAIFQVLNKLIMNDATKWYMLKTYAKFADADMQIQELYANHPKDWITKSSELSLIRYTAKKNIIKLVNQEYRTSDITTNCYYYILDNIFGQGNWEENTNSDI